MFVRSDELCEMNEVFVVFTTSGEVIPLSLTIGPLSLGATIESKLDVTFLSNIGFALLFDATEKLELCDIEILALGSIFDASFIIVIFAVSAAFELSTLRKMLLLARCGSSDEEKFLIFGT